MDTMKNENNQKIITLKNVVRKIILFFSLVLCFYICKSIVSPVFQTCDDAIMRDIISGNYSGIPDGHAVFVGYPLAWCISCLYKFIPNIEWYGIIWSAGLIISSFVIISDIIFCFNNIRKSTRFLISLLVLLGIYIPVFIVQQFTILAGVLAGTSIYFALSGKKRIYIFCFMLLSLWVRAEIFFVSIPFLFLCELWFLYKKKKDYHIKLTVIHAIIICLMIVIVIGIGKISEYFAYSSEQWKNYTVYNKSRSSLYDYTDILNNDSYKKELKEKGIDENTYFLIKKYMIYFDSNITKDTFEITKTVIDSKNEVGIARKIQDTAIKLVKMSVKDYWQFNLIVLLLLIILISNYVKGKKILEGIIVLLAEIGREIIVFYLLYCGRLPDRVYIGIILLELFFLFKIFVSEKKDNDLKRGKIYIICIVLFVCIFQNYKNQLSHRDYMIKSYDEINSTIVNYCKKNSSKVYFVNMPTNQYVFENRNENNNMCILSMYLTNCALMNRYTLDLSTKDIGETLYQYDKFRYIVDAEEDMEGLQRFFDSRFQGCVLEIEDSIEISGQCTYNVVMLKKQ